MLSNMTNFKAVYFPLNDMEFVETDVLVIGGGGAGLRAAIEASNSGVSVALSMKGLLGSSGSTVMATGAIAGVGSWNRTGDSVNVHFVDTIKGGVYLNEQRLVRILVEEASQRIVELECFGALWERTEEGERYLLRIGGGHSYPRSVYLEDRPGHEMLQAMRSEILKRNNIRVFEDTMVTKLLKTNGSLVGATTFNLATGQFTVFKSKAIVLATGGAGQLYSFTTQPMRNTGDGFALALQAGGELIDMEFIQFYSLGLLHLGVLKGVSVGTPYYSHLLNITGERFMERYDPERLELSTRDLVSRAIFKEIREGRGTQRGGVYCDMTFNPKGFIKKQLPSVYDFCMKIGVDPEKDRLEVAPTCHYFMGGIKVNDKWATSVPGLFAAGEVVGGVHGANRLSQNSLMDIIVSGARAGMSSARYAIEKSGRIPIDGEQVRVERNRIHGLLGRKAGVNAFVLNKKIKEVMWNCVGVVRNSEELELALKEIENIKKILPNVSVPLTAMRYNMEWIEAIELPNLLLVAEAIARSALTRTESRGAHFREDFPSRDDKNWLKHLVTELKCGNFKLSCCPVDLSEINPIEAKE